MNECIVCTRIPAKLVFRYAHEIFKEESREKIHQLAVEAITIILLPSYLKDIVSAVEHWRRSLTEQERNNLKLPLSFYLNTLNYQPESADYFSQIILNARKGNPEKYNETLKEHFGFELKKNDNGIQVWVYSLQPMFHVRILGNLGNLEIFEGTHVPR